MKGPVGSSASAPLVDFSMSMAGAGSRMLTSSQVTIDSGGTTAVNPPASSTSMSSGVSGMSGVRKVHSVSSGTLT